MANINVIGCDPGKTGSLCLLKLSDTTPPNIQFVENEAPIKAINEWLHLTTKAIHITMAMIEQVHSVFGASAKSNFQFGGNVRQSEVLLGLQTFGLDHVQPKEWQKFIGVTKKPGVKRTPIQLKKEIAARCEALYPGCDIRGPQGGLLDGRSDALMIAHYCAHKYK